MKRTPAPAGPTAPKGPGGESEANADREHSVWAPQRRRLTAGLVLTVTLVAFESLAVSTVMPEVSDDLGGLGLYGWVFSGFFLGTLVGAVLAGHSADRRGTAPPFLLGLVLFAVGVAAAGAAPSMAVLVGARVLQGIGAGAIPAVAYTSVGRAYPQAIRPRVFAVFSTAWVVPGLVGPAAASAIEHALSWRAVFWAILPLVGVAAVMTLPALRAADPDVAPPADADADAAGGDDRALDPAHRGARHARPTSDDDRAPTGADRRSMHDGPGAPAAPTATAPATATGTAGERSRVGLAVVLAGSAALVMAAPQAAVALAVVLVAVGLPVAVWAFLQLVPPGTLRIAAGLPAAVAVRGLVTFAFFGTDAFIPLALTDARDQDAWVGGVALTTATVLWTAAAWIQQHRVHRDGPRRLVTIGFLFLVLGVVGGQLIVHDAPIPLAIACWGLAGFGTGLCYAPLSVTVLGLAKPGTEGRATASLQLTDVLGVALGTGATGAIIDVGDGRGWDVGSSLAIGFALTATVALLGSLAARRLPDRLPTAADRD